MVAKKKEASVIDGREEVIDRGLFGEGAATARDPEDTITRVAKSNPYTGNSSLWNKLHQSCIVLISVWQRPGWV